MDGWRGEITEGQRNGGMDGWMEGRMDEWMGGRTMDGWTNIVSVVACVRLKTA